MVKHTIVKILIIIISMFIFVNTKVEAKVYEKTYRYAPTTIQNKMFYCSNLNNKGEIKDGIYFDEKLVLSTTPSSWDSAQVCDPSVVAGKFEYKDHTYRYLMAYLGCATLDNTNNEIGFAASNDLYNWTKVGRVVESNKDSSWGVGQPSLLNVDNQIYLFYTSGTKTKTTTFVELLDCSNLEHIIHLNKKEIITSYDFISNADFALEENTLYMVCDAHPFSNGALDFISDKQSIYFLNWNKTFEGLDNNWIRFDEISEKNTSHKKNHNACFNRDFYGNLLNHFVFVSTADEIDNFLNNLWTYHIMAVSFK